MGRPKKNKDTESTPVENLNDSDAPANLNRDLDSLPVEDNADPALQKPPTKRKSYFDWTAERRHKLAKYASLHIVHLKGKGALNLGQKWTMVYADLKKLPDFADLEITQGALQEKFRALLLDVVTRYGFTIENVNTSALDSEKYPDADSFDGLMLSMAHDARKNESIIKSKAISEKKSAQVLNSIEASGIRQQGITKSHSLFSPQSVETNDSQVTLSTPTENAHTTDKISRSSASSAASVDSKNFISQLSEKIKTAIDAAGGGDSPDTKRLKKALLEEQLAAAKAQRIFYDSENRFSRHSS